MNVEEGVVMKISLNTKELPLKSTKLFQRDKLILLFGFE